MYKFGISYLIGIKPLEGFTITYFDSFEKEFKFILHCIIILYPVIYLRII